MHAQPQHVAHDRVERAQVAVAADAEHRVIAALTAERSVAQLGRQGRVPAGQLPLRDELRQQQVGVGIAVAHREQHVQGDAAGRVGRPARSPAAALRTALRPHVSQE